ncbi:hypothetical protein A2924_00435 [Candidatus Giovannonibacteria bacterium RIFCSPLOWO2_01_FULL_44_16]|uniref:Uncharacterized protein n=1 Tax=Candidatus Giovannonibacteria bacterium RIFCSPLOWO2_01_FULL_44_16 TaxID=1798348 RepID=A0A1F5X3J2_9BACT|nr:MAG: hypothetical protein A2924_00435 [Candidatus Giovannonibacteria bacterium RIFCSPLOWO2_01_FULL_44_16]
MPLEYRVTWVWNHFSEISDERYWDLIQKDRELEERILELERQNTPQDPTYVPPDLNHDDAGLMYSEEYLQELEQNGPR